MAKRADEQPGEKRPLTVVGIGASAGGLAALQGFFDALPDNSGMVFVVVTHMDPERESLLPELLQTHTSMPVHQVQKQIAIEANHVYVLSPNRHIAITDHHLDVEEFEEPRGQRAPIDHFYRSLADAHRDAVAVILSGGGTDGAVGVKSIKEQGGLLMVQHPDEAEHDGMPRAAIATGLADVVLPVQQLAEKLVAYHQNGISLPSAPDAVAQHELALVQHILAQVQVRTGHDFSQYKQSTILRRIERRLLLTEHTSLDPYLHYLRHTPDEAHALFNDLLIGVTTFFRDTEAWQALAEKVIPHLFEGKKAGDTVRVWTIGCSTGEEAYTVAILLLEQAARLNDIGVSDTLGHLPVELQVFASDLDEGALGKAREGLYPEVIEADVSAERLARFFTKEGNYYRVRRELRDMVLFTPHSILRHPPFARLDLISCRNLLIYLNRTLQENVLDIFHYALNSERYLFLGSAESAEMMPELFHTLDKTHRIYQARPWRGAHPHVPSLPLTVHEPLRQALQDIQLYPGPLAGDRKRISTGLHQQALEQYGPPSILVDEAYNILHVSETAGRYLQVRFGPLSSSLLDLVRPELHVELREALIQAFNANEPVVTVPIHVQFNGTPRLVTLSVRPRRRPEDAGHLPEETDTGQAETGKAQLETDPFPAGERLALVLFLEHKVAETVEDKDDGPDKPPGMSPAAQLEGKSPTLVAKLQTEIQQLRQHARAHEAAYEASHEELKAANEELQSINEEYRSTTEELETSQEELQSLNEELQTVNAELKNKLEEIMRAHSDLENLMAATQIATLFLDRHLRIKRFTPGMEQLFNILPGDRGRPLAHLTNQLDYPALPEDAAQVLHTLQTMEREIQNQNGAWFLVRLLPYRTIDNRIDGLVITFVDITGLKQAETALRDAKAYSENIVDTVREGLLVLESDLKVQFANESFLQMFQVEEAQIIGKLVYHLGNGQWNIPHLRRLLEELLPQQNPLHDYRVEYDFEEIGRRVMLLNVRRLAGSDLILLAIEDITERERFEQELRTLTEQLEERVRNRTAQVHALALQLTMAEHKERGRISQILHDDLQQQLYGIQMQIGFLHDSKNETARDQEFQGMKEGVAQAIATTRRLSIDLSPPILQNEGLTEAVGWLARQMAQRYGLAVEVEAEGSFPVSDRDRRVLLFQMIRELLFNVVKHAGVLQVAVSLQQEDEAYRIVISDEGAGFDPEKFLTAGDSPDSLGLANVRHQLHLIGGRLEIESTPGQGTHLTIIAPISAPAQTPEAG